MILMMIKLVLIVKIHKDLIKIIMIIQMKVLVIKMIIMMMMMIIIIIRMMIHMNVKDIKEKIYKMKI